jgi:DNA-binding MarR family transcriptional regulator
VYRVGVVEETDHVGYVLRQWRRQLPELDRSAFAVAGRISRLAVLLQDQLETTFATHGVTGGEFDVLAALRREGQPYRLTPTELSTALIVTSGGMTGRLHALEDRDLVRRSPDVHDRRSTAVTLTPEGKRLVEETLADHTRNEERLVGLLSEGQRDQLAALLERFAVLLGDHGPPAQRTGTTRKRRSRGLADAAVEVGPHLGSPIAHTRSRPEATAPDGPVVRHPEPVVGHAPLGSTLTVQEFSD